MHHGIKSVSFCWRSYLQWVGSRSCVCPDTLPETNSESLWKSLKIGHPKRKRSFSNHPFSGAKMLVFGNIPSWYIMTRDMGIYIYIYLAKLKYFTNLDFPEIRRFPLLNHHLGWGRVRSLYFDQIYIYTWNLWMFPILELQPSKTRSFRSNQNRGGAIWVPGKWYEPMKNHQDQLGSPRKLGSMVNINIWVISPTYKLDILWVVPPPSNSSKWRFRFGSPSLKNITILVVTIASWAAGQPKIYYTMSHQ